MLLWKRAVKEYFFYFEISCVFTYGALWLLVTDQEERQ